MRRFGRGRGVALAALLVISLVLATGLAASGGATGAAPNGGVTGMTDDPSVGDSWSPAVAGTPAVDHAGTLAVDDDTILLHDDLFLVEESGVVGVTASVEIPDRARALQLTLRSATAGPIEVDGFDRVDDDGETWEWDGTTERPSITYRMDANDTAVGDGPLDGGGSYRFVDAGEWALVRTPVTDVSYSSVGGELRVDRDRDVDGEGVASQAMAFLGPHEEHRHEAAGQRFRLIVPAAADPVASPEEVFSAFEHAALGLQVGARNPEVVAIAAPTGEVEWAARGLQAGDRDMWVAADEPAGTADDVWTHEYVHARQSYDAEASARWFTEATATYYAALFAVERGVADFSEFQRTLARGERRPEATSILADPETWRGHPDYTKGSLAAGEIDRQLRVATDGEASLATVFRELNAASGSITSRTFLDAVEAAAAEGGDEAAAAAIREDAERYTTTEAAPEVWDRDAHAEAFGAPPAQVGYGLAAEGIRATGEFRDRPIDRGPVRLVSDETLELDVNVRNTGGVAGTYEVPLRVDDDLVAVENGTVDPDTERTVTLEHAFAEPGEHEVRIGSETFSVVVTEPELVTVTGLAVAPDDVVTGDVVVATAEVANDADVPAAGDVEFLVDDEAVASTSVRLDAGESTTVERELVMEGSGSVRVEAMGPTSGAAATVTVEGDGPLDGVADGIGETVESVPGFGPGVALVALLALLSVGTLRAGRR